MMKRVLIAAALALSLAACQTASRPSGVSTPSLPVTAGAQQVNIRASTQVVRDTLIQTAQQRGTRVAVDQPNMVILERSLPSPNPVLDAEYGPSVVGDRIIRVRVRFEGQGCNTRAVQDLALVNNAGSSKEQSFQRPGDSNTMQSLQGLKQNAEARGCGIG
ncbi:MAG: hypothetical protein ABJN26_21765 [Stappiaceae bacterium]